MRDVQLVQRPGNSVDPSAKSPQSTLGGLRVLLVDDNAETNELLDELLTQTGCIVLSVSNVQDALGAFARTQFDLLVGDIAMPVVDGYALIRKVRALPDDQRRIPAVAFTAYVHPDDHAVALRAGYDLHIRKPTDPRELLAILAQFVESQRARSL